MNIFLFVLVVLATYRLAELVSIDDISKPVRLAIGKKAGESIVWKKLADLINCPYCTGIWIAIMGAIIMKPTSVTFFIIYWLAIAGGQAFLEGATRRYSDDPVTPKNDLKLIIDGDSFHWEKKK